MTTEYGPIRTDEEREREVRGVLKDLERRLARLGYGLVVER
jgi:hypothetical protein